MSEVGHRILEEIAKTIEIPESAYETAEKRYNDLGSWFARPESKCSRFDPHVNAQGSFRLGTVIRPLKDDDAYDLDLACRLCSGITKGTYTQHQVKTLIGSDLESYRNARSIQKPKEEMHRCWRLEYADHLSFHMDIVPCIPEDHPTHRLIREAIVRARSTNERLARTIAELSVNITDNRHPDYRFLTTKWLISNPEGYARWFESRMGLARTFLESLKRQLRAAGIEEIPAFKWKTPLQRCVQMFKRHRDIMFADHDDVKPISIIITTLAAHSYQGEADLWEATRNLLDRMEGLINPQFPHVPNPVNPAEDFADKWDTPEGRARGLQQNFRRWLVQARSDFKSIASARDTGYIAELAGRKLHSHLRSSDLRERIGIAAPAVFTPKAHQIVERPAAPWRRSLL